MSEAQKNACSFIVNLSDRILTEGWVIKPEHAERGFCLQQTHRFGDVEVVAKAGTDNNLSLCLSTPWPIKRFGGYSYRVFGKSFKETEASFRLLDEGTTTKHSGGLNNFQWCTSIWTAFMVIKIELKGSFTLPEVSNEGDDDDDIFHQGPVNPAHVMRNMWSDMKFTDFNLVARGGREIPCHRCILCSSSPVMKKLLTADMEEGRQGFDNIDEEEDVLRAFLQYIYMGSLPADADHSLLLQLMRLGDYYQVTALPNKCASMLLPHVCEENILEVLVALKPLSQFSDAFQSALEAVFHMVKSDWSLLSVVCSNVVLPGFHAVRSQGMPTSGEAPVDVEMQSLAPVLSVDNGKHVVPPDEVEHDNAAFAPIKSEPSSSISEIGDSDSRQDTTNKSSVKGNQQDSVLFGADLEQSGHGGTTADSPKSLLEIGFNHEHGATAASGSATQQKSSSGPRRKTRRGKRTPKQEYLEQVSIPDTHNSWQ